MDGIVLEGIMNLKDLYTATPVARHADIRVKEDVVFVKNAAGDLDQYLMGPDGELWPVPEFALAKIKDWMTHLHTDIAAVKADTAAIKTKLGA
jgi:hypothetical protein